MIPKCMPILMCRLTRAVNRTVVSLQVPFVRIVSLGLSALGDVMFAKTNSCYCKSNCKWWTLAICSAVIVGVICVLWNSEAVVLNERHVPAAIDDNSQNSDLFQQVSGVSPERFKNIQCFLDTSIDETFHCRFHFVDLEDVERIVVENHLVPRGKMPSYLNSFGISGAKYPDWYDLRTIPYDSLVFQNSSGPVKGVLMWLYVDLHSKTGFLETMTQ